MPLVRRLGFSALNGTSDWYAAGGALRPEDVADALWAAMAFGIVAPETETKGMR